MLLEVPPLVRLADLVVLDFGCEVELKAFLGLDLGMLGSGGFYYRFGVWGGVLGVADGTREFPG